MFLLIAAVTDDHKLTTRHIYYLILLIVWLLLHSIHKSTVKILNSLEKKKIVARYGLLTKESKWNLPWKKCDTSPSSSFNFISSFLLAGQWSQWLEMELLSWTMKQPQEGKPLMAGEYKWRNTAFWELGRTQPPCPDSACPPQPVTWHKKQIYIVLKPLLSGAWVTHSRV